MRVTEQHRIPILARSLVDELLRAGYQPSEIIDLAASLLGELTQRLSAERAGDEPAART